MGWMQHFPFPRHDPGASQEEEGFFNGKTIASRQEGEIQACFSSNAGIYMEREEQKFRDASEAVKKSCENQATRRVCERYGGVGQYLCGYLN